MDGVRETLKGYISDEFAEGRDVDLDSANLLDEEIIDSLGIFTLIGFVESHFSVTIEPEEVNLDNFQTVDTIAALVRSKQQ
jgi:acyl carrier protein